MTHSMSAPPARPLTGCGTALVTPFNAGGSIDEGALRALIDWQIGEGVQFLVPCGSTGEAATMSTEEQRRVVEITVSQAKGRVPIVAGAASNDTAKAIALSNVMQDAGADYLLHTSPMYNKPPQRGIVAHYTAIARAVPLPIVLYNIPGRTGSNIEAKTTLELSHIPSIVGIKEASGNLGQMGDVIRGRPDGFCVLSGDDELTLPLMALGGDGAISAVANLVPRGMQTICERMRAGDVIGAQEMHFRMLPVMRAAFLESNPIPAKAALAMMGKVRNVLRLPLVPLSGTHEPALRAALVAAGAL
ncbi:MAG TPA: 4-hydroxy-tetrahydrodipicolinate synthase [Gemmatimonadaceae bacterium]|nr:4-hydroxy-tetrahydrodipicolinate synthase [Gemmatimonadaceae bacterium]